MLNDLMNMGAVAVPVKNLAAAYFRMHQLHLGDERLALIADRDTGELLCVCANDLTPALVEWIARFGSKSRPFTQCVMLQNIMGAGYVYCCYDFSERWTRQVKVAMCLKAHLANLLRAGPPVETDEEVEAAWREWKCN